MDDSKIEKIRVDDLIPYARNTRTHSDAQVAQIAASIREFGFVNPVLIDRDNGIIAGHARVLAARKLGLTEVPCLRIEHLDDIKKRAYIIADNKLAENAGWDEEMLRLELMEINSFMADLAAIGISNDDLNAIMSELDGKGEDASYYTSKIEAPIYRPTGEKPAVSELYDDTKAKELIEEINKADLPDDVKSFLRAAADRHIVFNFRKIAEYYAHSDPVVQELMERSALVIIDFGKAIENGFVELTGRLLRQYAKDYRSEMKR